MLNQRIGQIREQFDSRRVFACENRRRSTEKIDGRGCISATKRSLSGRSQLLCCSSSYVLGRTVDRTQLAAISIRLLEVVAEDLLELQLAAALLVDRLSPTDESLVEVGTRSLEQAPVGGVLDDRMAESVELILPSSWADELLGRQRLQVRRNTGGGLPGDEVDDGLDREAETDHGGRIDHLALL